MKGPALVVMARAPVPGQVKTRLQPDLTPEQCAAVYEAFLRDTLNLAVSLSQYTCFLAFTPSEACIFFEGFTQREIILLPQTGNNLGQRMYHLMHLLENMEYSPVVLIGSDIPTLQPGILQQAIEELRTFDLCLGPSQDGGYYLVGSRHADKRIFCGIPWSTPDVLKITIRKAKEAEKAKCDYQRIAQSIRDNDSSSHRSMAEKIWIVLVMAKNIAAKYERCSVDPLSYLFLLPLIILPASSG